MDCQLDEATLFIELAMVLEIESLSSAKALYDGSPSKKLKLKSLILAQIERWRYA